MRSIKPTHKPFKVSDNAPLRVKKVHAIYTKVYNVGDTICFEQTGQFLQQSQRSNKYIKGLVRIDSNSILVKPINSLKDAKMSQACRVLKLCLKQVGIMQKNKILNNKISENTKDLICNKNKMEMELVPPGCHRQNTVKVAVRHFKAHILSVLTGVANDSPIHF